MISRAGNASIRHALYMPGMVALRYNPILKTFGERLLASGHASKAVIGENPKGQVLLSFILMQFNPNLFACPDRSALLGSPAMRTRGC